MKFLFVYYTHKPGGLCKRLYRLQSALVTAGHSVTYLSLDAPPIETINEEVQWRRIPFFMKGRSGVIFWILFTLWLPLYCCFTVARSRPDKLIAFGAFYSATFFLSRVLFGKRIVLFLRSLVFVNNRLNSKNIALRSLSSLLERFGILAASKVIFMTEAMRAEVNKFIRWQIRNYEILPNNVASLRTRKVVHQLPLNILMSGVIDERKNIRFVLRALSELPGDIFGKIRLFIAGDGPKMTECCEKALRLRLTNVTFLGWTKDLSELYDRCQVFIHSSFHEGVSNSLTEALSQGMVVLVSDIPEHREMLSKDNLFSLKSTEELCSKLTGLVKDPKQLDQLEISSRAAAQRLVFDWDDKAVAMVL